MKQKIMFLLFFKISGFIFFLSWISHFNNEASTFIKYLDKNYNNRSKIDKKNYRLLAKYKQCKNYNDVGLKDNIQNKWEHEEKNIYNNNKWVKGKNKQSNRSLLNKAQYYTEFIDYNNGMFDGKHFHFEKKWIKKKDYDDFLEKKRRIRDITLKKIKFRKYRYGVAIFVIFLLFGIGVPLSSGISFLDVKWDAIKEDPFGYYFYYYLGNIPEYVQHYFYIILYSLLIIILSIIFIVTMYKILRNNEKYKKIKLMTE
ncbi:fam-m protein [Plasmodium malariae]|uniref:Fam-m protein n=1 Tax=Plasmodium malariae TaxID=5858 RepID=A0A1D3JI06_PLAMA|nr:fam-m protein [Plasmodium malariae]SBT86070.1 fam-m protein [Plasmodium malariae]